MQQPARRDARQHHRHRRHGQGQQNHWAQTRALIHQAGNARQAFAERPRHLAHHRRGGALPAPSHRRLVQRGGNAHQLVAHLRQVKVHAALPLHGLRGWYTRQVGAARQALAVQAAFAEPDRRGLLHGGCTGLRLQHRRPGCQRPVQHGILRGCVVPYLLHHLYRGNQGHQRPQRHEQAHQKQPL
ncbi:hypothetical protein D3C71_963370 [compost metagenome]